jgi:hypothetical protein
MSDTVVSLDVRRFRDARSAEQSGDSLRVAATGVYVLSVVHASGEFAPPPRQGQNLPPHRQRPPRSVGLILCAAVFGLVALIGLAFLMSGLELITGPVIRTTATVIAVRADPAYGPAEGKNGTTFTLRFTDQDHQVVTEQTQEVEHDQPVAPGDRIQVYVPADPSDVTDVRFGAPGEYDFFMAELFFGIAVAGWTGVLIARVRRKRRFARLANGPGEAKVNSGGPHRVADMLDGRTPLDELLDGDD